MIQSVKIGKEFVVIAANKVGALNKVSGALADRGIDILAVSAQAAGGVALMNLVTDEPVRTKDVLLKKGYRVHENSVLLVDVEDKPGVLMQMTKKLATRKVDILNVYGSASSSYGPCLLVISTNDNQKALVTLSK